jgi:DNA topoisomerase VI subunit A
MRPASAKHLLKHFVQNIIADVIKVQIMIMIVENRDDKDDNCQHKLTVKRNDDYDLTENTMIMMTISLKINSFLILLTIIYDNKMITTTPKIMDNERYSSSIRIPPRGCSRN